MIYDKPLKLGIGTGRCGTVSFAKLIDAHRHELKPLLPWKRDLEVYRKHKNRMGIHRKFVAFYYLNYLPQLQKDFKELRVICLKRDKKETVESYMRKVPNANHWMRAGDKTKWSKCYPTYDCITKKRAIERYWEDYYSKAEKWAELDWFKIMNMRDVLNTEAGQKEAFEHLGLEFTGFQKYHKNATS